MSYKFDSLIIILNKLDGGEAVTVNGFEGIKQWIYRWIPYVEVVGPKELREELKRDLKAEMQKHDR